MSYEAEDTEEAWHGQGGWEMPVSHGRFSGDAFDIVRVVRLNQSERWFVGMEGSARPPQIGDVGTVLMRYDPLNFAVECTADEATTIWLADFQSDEIELVEKDPGR